MAPIIFVSAMTVAMLALASMAASWAGAGDQQRLVVPDPYQPVKGRNISVGFSLEPSYVSGTVLFTYDDDTVEWHTESVQSGDEYREVMKRLSLPSSRHLA
ncbi:hypothetical protein IMZ48_49505 [Candidatus Bathyarchaeota archaeon]|nr:hypothetical protein [Candidatus Bathyarchaeota archaeon]